MKGTIVEAIMEKAEEKNAFAEAVEQDLKERALEQRGKDAAACYLERRGCAILERDWACFAGAVDIIARDEERGDLVFVEVQTHVDAKEGFPSEDVSAEKRSRYEKIALAYLKDYYLAGNEDANFVVRFDTICLMVLSDNRAMIKHHIGVFCCA